MNKQEQDNQISIIINGVRYDAVEPNDCFSANCSLYEEITGCSNCVIGAITCDSLIGIRIFQKSDKKFEV
mgnify:CR=1 FL=1